MEMVIRRRDKKINDWKSRGRKKRSRNRMLINVKKKEVREGEAGRRNGRKRGTGTTE
jgi:hypothetical protein